MSVLQRLARGAGKVLLLNTVIVVIAAALTAPVWVHGLHIEYQFAAVMLFLIVVVFPLWLAWSWGKNR